MISCRTQTEADRGHKWLNGPLTLNTLAANKTFPKTEAVHAAVERILSWVLVIHLLRLQLDDIFFFALNL